MPDSVQSLRRDLDRATEKVEILMGSRGDATRSQSAVRRTELRALASIDLKSSQVAAAPTQADFNRLQADVAAISDALRKIANALGTAILPKPIP